MSETDELRKALDFMRIWITDDAHLGESVISRELEKAEGLRKLDAIEQAIAATLCGQPAKLTAEQVRGVLLLHLPHREYYSIAQTDGWQAIADELNVMLGNDDDYEAKMDALLCRLTNGKWSKSRAYDLDFMVSCVNEEYEKAYAEELAATTQGATEIVRCRDCKWFTPEYWYEEERGFGLTETICEPPDCGNPIRCATTYNSFTKKYVPIHIITEPDGFCAWAERREQ